MAKLTYPVDLLHAFYRQVMVTKDDDSLVEQGEDENEVGYLALNHGVEQAQLFVLSSGGNDWWEKKSSAIVWLGSDSAGGRYWALPTDFLRFAGSKDRCPLIELDGSPWDAIEINADRKDLHGDYYYLRGSNLWITYGASPPTTVYLEYIYRHPEITSTVTLDFPEAARGLIVAYAAQHAIAEGWFPGDGEAEARILRNVQVEEMKARKVTRRVRGPRHITAPRVIGTRHWT